MNIELLKKLEQYPLFTLKDLSKIMLDKKSNYLKVLVQRLEKRGLIHKIERGKYTVHKDPMIFATKIFNPSYVSLWTALRFYNMTEQLPRDIFVCVPEWRKEIEFFDATIKFVQTKHMWGYKKTRYNEFEIFMAEKEKAILDSLLSNKVPFYEVVKGIEKASKKKIKKYAIRTNNKSLIKRVGFLLEVFGADCSDLKEKIDYNYVKLDPLMERKGKKNRRWRIIVNRKVRENDN